MIVLLDTPQDLTECSHELGAPVEQLFTPLTRRAPQRPEERFAIDNGAFARFDPDDFKRLLERHHPRRDLCRFVTVPDIVGDARRTAEVFEGWELELSGWPLAYACQDGQQFIPIPWPKIAAIFVGGSTDWKISAHAVGCIKAAKALGKWVHIGRVNTPGRYEWAEELGADSIDGTGLARYSHMRDKIYRNATEPQFELTACAQERPSSQGSGKETT